MDLALEKIAQELVSRGARPQDAARLAASVVCLARAADAAGALVAPDSRFTVILGASSRSAALRVRSALASCGAVTVTSSGMRLGPSARVEVAAWVTALVREAGQAGQQSDNGADNEADNVSGVRSSLRSLRKSSKTSKERALSGAESEAARQAGLSAAGQSVGQAAGSFACPACPGLEAEVRRLAKMTRAMGRRLDFIGERLGFLCDIALAARDVGAPTPPLVASSGAPPVIAAAPIAPNAPAEAAATASPRRLWGAESGSEEAITSTRFAEVFRAAGREPVAIEADFDEARTLPHERVRLAVASVLLKQARGKGPSNPPGLVLTLMRGAERGEPGADGSWAETDVAVAAARTGVTVDGVPLKTTKRAIGPDRNRHDIYPRPAAPQVVLPPELLDRARRELEGNSSRPIPDSAVLQHARSLQQAAADPSVARARQAAKGAIQGACL